MIDPTRLVVCYSLVELGACCKHLFVCPMVSVIRQLCELSIFVFRTLDQLRDVLSLANELIGKDQSIICGHLQVERGGRKSGASPQQVCILVNRETG